MKHDVDPAAPCRGLDIFEGLPDAVFRRFAQDGVSLTFAPGALVTEEGSEVGGLKPFARTGVYFHVVTTGSGEVRQHGTRIGEVGPGSYFGELSLIDGGPRTADVVAGPDGLQTFALTKWTFEDLLRDYPQVAVPLLRVVTRRLRRAEAGLGAAG